MGRSDTYFGDCKFPYSKPADCKSAGTGGIIRSTVSLGEFLIAFIPYVGPVISIAITAYDLGGGFDDNLYSIGKR